MLSVIYAECYKKALYAQCQDAVFECSINFATAVGQFGLLLD